VELPEERRQSDITVWETKIVETDEKQGGVPHGLSSEEVT